MKNSAFLLVPLLFLTACGREEIATCQVPKESSAPTQVSTMGSSAEIEAVQASHAAMSESASSGAGYESSLPAGWAEIPGSGMRKASYKIQGTSIDFYLISLSMGDVPSNVNRWRGQVGLPPASPEAIAQNVVAFQADGHAVSYIEIYNEEGGQGIIAAIVDLKPQYWYFTAKGSVGELKTHAADIRAFLESIHFEGHNHE